VPGAPLQGCRGGGALQQGLEQGRQRLCAGIPQAGRQQQRGCFARRGDGGFEPVEGIDRIHIALQLVFLLQQALHQGAVAGIVF
jgi:hypothetical protein